jgi:hypothetical protein
MRSNHSYAAKKSLRFINVRYAAIIIARFLHRLNLHCRVWPSLSAVVRGAQRGSKPAAADGTKSHWPNLMASLTTFKLVSLFAVSIMPANANVCTPFNYPANGPFPAVINGIDAVDWGVARIQWTSDTMPVTSQKIMYATAAEWAANPGVYGHTQGEGATYLNGTSVIQGSPLANLLPGTTYHVIGQSYAGGSWCTATDETFTTLAKPAGQILPQLPQTFSTTRPTVTGTVWTYGSNCGTSGTVSNNLQDCFNKAQPGDGIALPPGTYNTYQISIPRNPNAVLISSINGSTITSPSHGMANGQQIHLGAAGFPSFIPPPLNPGVTYKVINATANTFQASYDGINAVTFTNTGAGNIYYVKWPLTQNYVVVHSTAPASSLPPDGVRMDPVAYGSYLPNIQMNDPSRPLFYYGELSSYYWFQNIEFSTDPAVAAASGTGVDPVGFTTPYATNSVNDHIVHNQCAFMFSLPPSRAWYIQAEGSNIGYLNSYIRGLDWWQPFRAIPAATSTSSSLTIPAGSYYWVGAGGTIGTKKTCTTSGGSMSNFSGSGSYVIWMDPTNCSLVAQLQTGLTATVSGMTATSAASPILPTFTYVTTSGVSITQNTELGVGYGSVTNGVNNYQGDLRGQNGGNGEGGQGLAMASGPGPLMFVNTYLSGSGVTGIFATDNLTDLSSPCGGGTQVCPVQYNQGNITEQRSTITTNPCYFADSACWNGGNYSWRNLDEMKQAKYVRQDGNIFGPYFVEVSQGECGASHFTYNAGFLSTGFPAYADSSEWTFTNNTCLQTGAGGIYNGFSYTADWLPYPMKNAYVHNNLFLNDNGYAQYANLEPLGVAQSCGYGKIMQWGEYAQNLIFDHNTIYGRGGCAPWLYDEYTTLSSGMQLTNNIFDLVSDPSNPNLFTTGTYYQANEIFGGSADAPDCDTFQGTALFNCMSQFTWGGNVIVATWTNSKPGSQVDYTNAQIASVQSLFPSNTYFPTAGSARADRIAQVSWFNPSTGNLRLTHSSPYISGARASLDGLDVGVDMDALEAAQGKVSNVHTYGTSSTSTTVGFLAPDSFACTVDWGTSNFASGSGTFTRVANAGGQRVQNVTLAGLPAHALVYYRVNCAVQQPQGTVQLP